jgi:hypothetical protein
MQSQTITVLLPADLQRMGLRTDSQLAKFVALVRDPSLGIHAEITHHSVKIICNHTGEHAS